MSKLNAVKHAEYEVEHTVGHTVEHVDQSEHVKRGWASLEHGDHTVDQAEHVESN